MPCRSLRLLLAVFAATLFGACATTGGGSVPSSPGAGPGTPTSPGAPSGGVPGGSGTKPAPIPSTTPLATEQRFLTEWFRGTPVVISTQPPSLLQVSVPLANSFDAGRSDIKPALNAVLDRVAESMRRHPGARLTINAPPDGNGAAALAQARSAKVRDSLGGKGVNATRVTTAELPQSGPLLLQLAMPAMSSTQPVARRSEPAPAAAKADVGGVQPISTGKSVPMWTEKKQP